MSTPNTTAPDLRAAAQAALEALTDCWSEFQRDDAINALRAALAAPTAASGAGPQPLPAGVVRVVEIDYDTYSLRAKWRWPCPVEVGQELAAAAQAAPIPAGWKLVPECPFDAQPMIAAFIKEDIRPGGSESGAYRAMLAAAPQPPAQAAPQPLTDAQINALISASEVHEYHPGAILEFVRAIERAHGITGGSNAHQA